MNKYPLIIAAVLASLAISFGAAHASSAKHHDGFHKTERLMAKLELTDNQQKSVTAIIDSARSKMRQLRQEMKEGREKIHEYVNIDSIDEQQLAEFTAAQGALASRSIVGRIQMMRDIRGVLTDKQWEEAQKVVGKSRKHRHCHGDK